MGTFGPDYKQKLDEGRIMRQMERIRDVMLDAGKMGQWLTLSEIQTLTGYPESSISAQLRHLRKECFGKHIVRKRRRGPETRGLWEYFVKSRPVQLKLFTDLAAPTLKLGIRE